MERELAEMKAALSMSAKKKGAAKRVFSDMTGGESSAPLVC